MAVSKIQKAVRYTDVPFSGIVVDAKSFKDVDTGIAPQSTDFQVLVKALSWCILGNAWIKDGQITVTVNNPFDFQVTTDSWNALRIYWL